MNPNFTSGGIPDTKILENFYASTELDKLKFQNSKIVNTSDRDLHYARTGEWIE